MIQLIISINNYPYSNPDSVIFFIIGTFHDFKNLVDSAESKFYNNFSNNETIFSLKMH